MLLRCFFTIREPPFDAATNCLHSWRKETLRRLMHCNKRLGNCKLHCFGKLRFKWVRDWCGAWNYEFGSQDLLLLFPQARRCCQYQLSGSPNLIGLRIHMYLDNTKQSYGVDPDSNNNSHKSFWKLVGCNSLTHIHFFYEHNNLPYPKQTNDNPKNCISILDKKFS